MNFERELLLSDMKCSWVVLLPKPYMQWEWKCIGSSLLFVNSHCYHTNGSLKSRLTFLHISRWPLLTSFLYTRRIVNYVWAGCPKQKQLSILIVFAIVHFEEGSKKLVPILTILKMYCITHEEVKVFQHFLNLSVIKVEAFLKKIQELQNADAFSR